MAGGIGSIEKRWRSAIIDCLDRRTRIEQLHDLQRIAETMIVMAAGGDMAAIKELGDRLDGKPAQALSVEGGDPNRPLVMKWMDQIPKL